MAIGLTTQAAPSCTESTLDVLDGVVYVSTRDDEWILTPGDSAHIARGVPYQRWDAGDEEANWVEVHCVG